MRKRKKLIIGAVMAAVLLFGSVVGVALADDESNDPQSPAGVQEMLAGKLGITVEELQAIMDEVRAEFPQRGCEGWQCQKGPAGCFGNLFGDLDEETQAALKADLAQAKEEMNIKVAEIFESYGIDTDALKAECAVNTGNKLPVQRGFNCPRGMGGKCGFAGTTPPVE